MPGPASDRFLARDAKTVWQCTLSQVGGTFAQLVYLSTLRDPQTAQYAHHGLASRFSEAESAQVLLSSHRQVFTQWLQLGISQKHQELADYLSGLEEVPATVVHNWLSVKYYRAWMPVDTPLHEQAHYLADIEALLQIIQNEYGGIEGHRES